VSGSPAAAVPDQSDTAQDAQVLRDDRLGDTQAAGQLTDRYLGSIFRRQLPEQPEADWVTENAQ
jgi:hypothetical protein